MQCCGGGGCGDAEKLNTQRSFPSKLPPLSTIQSVASRPKAPRWTISPEKKLSKFLHWKGFSVVGGAPRRTTGPSPNRCLYLQKPRRPPHLSCLYIRTVFTFLCLLQGGRQLLLFVPVLLPGGGRTSCCCLWFSISHRR